MDCTDLIEFTPEEQAERDHHDSLLQQEWEERDAAAKAHGHDEFALLATMERLKDASLSFDILVKVFEFAERHTPSANSNPKLDPTSAQFDALETSKYLYIKILSFKNAGGLRVYWQSKKVQQRLQLLPDAWRIELNRRQVERLDAINDHGPDLIQ